MGYTFGISPSQADTDAKFAVGDVGVNKDGKWKYVQANGAVAQYAACKVDNDGQASELTTTISGSEPTGVGIPQVALADNEYGWAFIGEGGGSGKGVKVLAAANCAAGAKLYTTATDGVVDDTATDLIAGATLVTANGGSQAAVEVYSPVIMATNAQD